MKPLFRRLAMDAMLGATLGLSAGWAAYRLVGTSFLQMIANCRARRDSPSQNAPVDDLALDPDYRGWADFQGGTLRMSSTGRSVAIVMPLEYQLRLVINGSYRDQLGWTDRGKWSAEDLLFRPGNEETTCVIRTPEGVCLTSPAGTTGPFERVISAVWSADGQCFGYIFRRGELDFPVIGGVQWPPWRDARGLALSTHGDHWGFVAGLHGQEWIVTDGGASGPFREAGPIHFAPGCNTLAFRTGDEDGERWIVGGRPGARQMIVEDLVFSANGKSFAYVAEMDPMPERPSFPDPAWCVVHDGRPGPEFRSVRNLQLSDDGKLAVYFAQDRRVVYVIAGKERSRADEPLDPDRLFPAGTLLPRPVVTGTETWIIAGKWRRNVPNHCPTIPPLVFPEGGARVGWCEFRGDMVWYREEPTR